jgi:DNA recombination protein RmuC
MVRRARGRRDDALSLLQGQVQAALQDSARETAALRENVGRALQELSGRLASSLSESNRTVGERLDTASRVIGDVKQQLGQLDVSARRIADIGRDISRLDDILRPPKLRGALSELFLAELLGQILPAGHYELQHAFRDGQVVDAVVRLRSGLVPIDAKFPLENFRRVLAASADDARRAARRQFVRDVKVHIDAIARKYIRLDENTFDFALMYIPAENVYYETIIKDDEFGGDMALFTYALGRRVIPVSPNSFYAYLQTIILGLKGMRVEESAREILEDLARLQREFNNFSDAFRLVGQHMDNAAKKYADAQKRFGKIEGKMEQIDGLARGLNLPAAGREEEKPGALAPTDGP